MGGSGAKKPVERTGAVLSAVGGLLAIIVAATQQRPASSIAITASILLPGGWALFWAFRATTALGKPRFPVPAGWPPVPPGWFSSVWESYSSRPDRGPSQQPVVRHLRTTAGQPAHHHCGRSAETAHRPGQGPKPVVEGAPNNAPGMVTLPVPRPDRDFAALVTVSGVDLSGSPAG
jgi:hypothetical protein